MYCPTRMTIRKYTTIRRTRVLPARGEVLIGVGASIETNDMIAKYLPHEEPVLIDVARGLSVSDQQAGSYLQKEIGDVVQAGEVIAAKKGAVGLLGNKSCRSPVNGTILAINRGRVLVQAIPAEPEDEQDVSYLPSLLRGKVIEVIDGYGVTIESSAGLIEGVWGMGGAASGFLKVMVDAPDEPLTTAAIDVESQGFILVGGTSIDQAALLRASEVKAKGVVVGSIQANLTELESKLPFPVIVTEGFGQIAMSDIAFDVLRGFDGEMAYINGSPAAPDIQTRPEVIVFPAARGQISDIEESTLLMEGAMVRATRAPYLGRIGVVKSIPSKARVVESGLHVRGAEVEMPGGERVFIPIANLERIR